MGFIRESCVTHKHLLALKEFASVPSPLKKKKKKDFWAFNNHFVKFSSCSDMTALGMGMSKNPPLPDYHLVNLSSEI